MLIPGEVKDVKHLGAGGVGIIGFKGFPAGEPKNLPAIHGAHTQLPCLGFFLDTGGHSAESKPALPLKNRGKIEPGPF